MDSRRVSKNAPLSNDFLVVKQWKESGPEQRELEKLIKNKTIDDTDSPSEVRQNNPIFREFSQRVFNAHFRKTKAKLGYFGEFILNNFKISKIC